MLQNKNKFKSGVAAVEYAILISLVGLAAGLAFWQISKDPQKFRDLFKSMWGAKTTQTTTSNTIQLQVPPMDNN